MDALSPRPPARDYAALGRAHAEVGFLEGKGALTATEAARLRAVLAREEASLLEACAPSAADDLIRVIRASAPHLLGGLDRAYGRHPQTGTTDADTTGIGATDAGTTEAERVPTPPAAEPARTPKRPPHDAPRRRTEPQPIATQPIATQPIATQPTAAPNADPRVAQRESQPPSPDRWRMGRFLERMNIHWGLLAGALLIVGCSIALIITLWRSESFFVRYATFVGVTVGLALAGRFAWRRLGLTSTGTAVLTVAMMLMPLGLLAADFAPRGGGAPVPWSLRLALWAGYAALAVVSLRGVASGAYRAFALAFPVLLFAQLLSSAVSFDAWWWSTWGLAAVYLAAMHSIAQHAEKASDGALSGIASGILAFAFALIPIRLVVEVPLNESDVGPFVALAAAGLLVASRRLTGSVWSNVVRTTAHLAIPVSLALAWNREPTPMLLTAGTLCGIYAALAWVDRSHAALIASGATGTIAAVAAIALRHAVPGAPYPWAAEPLPILAFDLVVVALVGSVFAEAARRTWAGPTLRRLATFVLAFATLGCALDHDVFVRVVAMIGVGAALGFVWTRRARYGYAAAASLPGLVAIDPAPLIDLGLDLGAIECWLGAIGAAYALAGVGLARGTRFGRTARILRHASIATAAFAVCFAWRPHAISTTAPLPVLLAAVAWLVVAIRSRNQILAVAAGCGYGLATWLFAERVAGPVTTPDALHVIIAVAAGAVAFAGGCVGPVFARRLAHHVATALFTASLVAAWAAPQTGELAMAVTSVIAFALALCRRTEPAVVPAAVATFAVTTASFAWFRGIAPIDGWQFSPFASWFDPAIPRWIAAAPFSAGLALTALARWTPGRALDGGRAPASVVLALGALANLAACGALVAIDPDPRKVWVVGLAILTGLALFRRWITDRPVLQAATFATGLMVGFGAVFDALPTMAERYAAASLAAVVIATGFAWRATAPEIYRYFLHAVTFVVSAAAVLGAANHHGAGSASIAWPGLVACALGVATLAHVRFAQSRISAFGTVMIALASTALLVWSTVLLGTWSVAWLPLGFVALGFGWLAWQRLDGDRVGRAVAVVQFGIATTLAAQAPTAAGSLAAGYLATALAIVGRSSVAVAALGTLTAFAQLHAFAPVIPGPATAAEWTAFAGLAVALTWTWEVCHRVFGGAAFRVAALATGLAALGFVGQAGWLMDVEQDVVLRTFGVVFIAAVAAFCFGCALRDRREGYVYLTQGALVGLFAYVRFTHPWLFDHEWARRAWPLTLIGAAFGALAVAAWSSRRDRFRAFERPFAILGSWLPIVSLAGAWFVPEIDHVTVGTIGLAAAFYALSAWSRGNLPLGYLAVATANVAVLTFVWVLDLDPRAYPQAYLAPIGSSLIGIAHWQRSSLGAGALQALRTIGTAIIYASLATAMFADASHRTTEMFALAILSVLGIIAGIGYRIRAFLYAGTGFLVFDVAYMVFRAGREDTWIWWVSGITLGVAVMFGFALAERYRDRMRRALRELRAWS